MMANPFVEGSHHALLCAELDALAEGSGLTNLLINVPPGHTKSILTSVVFPARELARNPATRIMSISYDHKLSLRDSEACRRLVQSPWYQSLWPHVRIRTDSNAKGYWATTAGGWRMATSVGGHATGEHPHYIIIDDPQSAATVESEAEREALADFLTLTLATRGVALGVRKIGVQQRLRHDDFTAGCLATGGWRHVCLPFRFRADHPYAFPGDVRQPGELLFPRLFSPERAAALEKELGAYGAAAQLDQYPVLREGGFFETSRLRIVDAAPVGLRECRWWDCAATPGGGDWTAGVKLGVATDGQWYVMDEQRGQWGTDERIRRQRQTAELDGKACVVGQEEEPGSAGKDQTLHFTRLMAGHIVATARPTGPKAVRAAAYSAQVNAGNVALVRGEWNAGFIERHQLFRGAGDEVDDEIDAAAGAFNELVLRGKRTLWVA